jgi:predicted DNA-binding protein
MRKASQTTSLRLTPEAKRLLQALATKMGIPMSSVIELAIRLLAERESVK